MAYQGLAREIGSVMVLARASGLFVSLASFSAPTGAQGPTGNPTGAYTDVAGLTAIPCMNAPQSDIRVSSDEVRTMTDIQAGRYRHVLLNDNYPAVVAGWPQGWRVTITDPNGTVTLYTMTGAENDSQDTQTRLKLQVVTL